MENENGDVDKSKRKFLWQAAVLGVSTFLPDVGSASGFDRGNAFDALKDFTFKDQNGNMLNGVDLKTQLGGSDFTVSLSLNSCATGVCTPENMNLAKIVNAYPNLKHVVINANPEVEGINQEVRDSYAETIAHGSIADGNLIILYPSSNKEVTKVSSALGNVTLMENATHHSSVISIYDGNGDFKDCLLGNSMRDKSTIGALGKYDGACR